MILRVAACALACLSLLTGCGGDGGGSDAAQVEAAAETYLTELAAFDGDAACAVMTDDLQDQLVTAVAATLEQNGQAGEFDTDSCADVIDYAAEEGGPETREAFGALEASKISDIMVDGESATFTVRITVRDQSIDVDSEAQRVDGEWRISCCLGPG